MHPILFQLGSFTLYSYGVLVALGFIVGIAYLLWYCKSDPAATEKYLEGAAVVTLGGFLCARLLYVAYFPSLYSEQWWHILTDRGGFVWYGGLIGGVLAALAYFKWRKLSLLKSADTYTVPLALALAVGRIGCYLAGCCYGTVCTLPWAVGFPPGHPSYPHSIHPTQLYESIGVFIIALILWRLTPTLTAKPGRLFASFLMSYGILRFLVECVRGDVVFWVDHWLSASQVISLAGLGLGLWLWMHTNVPATHSNTPPQQSAQH